MLKHLSLLALVSHALAQNTPTLAEALAASPDLSTLGSVLSLAPNLANILRDASNITILAPSNEAFAALGNETLTALSQNVPLVTAILQYHVLAGTFPASAIPEDGAFVASLLNDVAYTNVTGGQRVKAQAVDDGVVITSGLLDTSNVVQADVNFTGGVIHVIDRVLTVPEIASETLNIAGLTSLRGALVAANLVDTVEEIPNVTIFAPNNEAFQAIGSALGSLTPEEVTSILTYHVVAGDAPGYSTGLTNGTVLTTAQGEDVTVTINDEGIFVNGAKVVTPDVLIANGVVHVIDGVLNPSNPSSPAYPSASPIPEPPFTSGQPTPTRSIGGGAAPTNGTSPSGTPSPSAPLEASTAGAPAAMRTGAVGMGAVLGAAAVWFM